MESSKMRSCPSLVDKFVGSEYDTIVKIADALPMLLELYAVFQGKEDKLAMICTEIAANGNYFALTDHKNARAWGYIGDGTYHPLQEWVDNKLEICGKYATKKCRLLRQLGTDGS